MLQELLHMRAWLAILARRAGRREPRKSPFCQLQAATTDRGDTGIADERRQMLGEVFHTADEPLRQRLVGRPPFQPAAPAVAKTPVPTSSHRHSTGK